VVSNRRLASCNFRPETPIKKCASEVFSKAHLIFVLPDVLVAEQSLEGVFHILIVGEQVVF
jgi:hypothetical protein